MPHELDIQWIRRADIGTIEYVDHLPEECEEIVVVASITLVGGPFADEKFVNDYPLPRFIVKPETKMTEKHYSDRRMDQALSEVDPAIYVPGYGHKRHIYELAGDELSYRYRGWWNPRRGRR